MKLIPVWAAHRGIVYAMVDDEDFYLVAGYAWRFRANGKGTSFHIATSIAYRVDGVRKEQIVMMHHAIVGPPPVGYDINHINGDVYDNQKYNLEIIPSLRHSSISGLMEVRRENRGYVKGGS